MSVTEMKTEEEIEANIKELQKGWLSQHKEVRDYVQTAIYYLNWVLGKEN